MSRDIALMSKISLKIPSLDFKPGGCFPRASESMNIKDGIRGQYESGRNLNFHLYKYIADTA